MLLLKHFAVSNFSASQFEFRQSRLDELLITNQIEINPMNFDVLENGTTFKHSPNSMVMFSGRRRLFFRVRASKVFTWHFT